MVTEYFEQTDASSVQGLDSARSLSLKELTGFTHLGEKVGTVAFYLRRTATAPSGNIYAKIYNDSAVLQATSDPLDSATLTTSLVWYDFNNFDSYPDIETNWFITVEAVTAGTTYYVEAGFNIPSESNLEMWLGNADSPNDRGKENNACPSIKLSTDGVVIPSSKIFSRPLFKSNPIIIPREFK